LTHEETNRLNLCLTASTLALAFLPMGGVSQQPASSQPVATLHVQAREVLLPVTVPGQTRRIGDHAAKRATLR